LKAAIGCTGVGLHNGLPVSLTLRPAAENTGIVFRRTDLGVDVEAAFDRVADTFLCTQIAHPAHRSVRVGTVEHLLAALAGSAVDNAIVEIDGPELPILDGSASPYLFLIDCAGIADQAAPRLVLEVVRPVRVQADQAYAELRPAASRLGADRNPTLDLSFSIDFPAAAIGRQAMSIRLSTAAFRRELANARTFVLAQDVERLRAAGLARGGSLDNAVVVEGDRILNPGGLRSPTEFVRHKLLDAVGDLALAGPALHAQFIGHRSGHALNNLLLRALFADATAYRLSGGEIAVPAAMSTAVPSVARPALPVAA